MQSDSQNSTSSLQESFGQTSIPLWLKAVLFGVAYFICAEAGKFLSVQGGTYTSFWLPAGLYVAVLLLNERRDWPWLVLATFPANLVFDLLHGSKLVIILFFFCANTVQAVTGAWLVRRFVAERPTLDTLKEFIGLLAFAAVLSTMLGATIGATTLTAFGLSNSFLGSWKVWWGSNAMAVLVFMPFLLMWFSNPDRGRQPWNQPKRRLEAILVSVCTIVLVWHILLVQGKIMSTGRAGLIFLFLWASLRFSRRYITAIVFLFAVTTTVFGTAFLKRQAPDGMSSGEYVFALQILLAAAALIGLIPAIVLSERDRTVTKLRESEEHFRNLTEAAFEGIGISENGRLLDMNDQMLKMFGYERGEMVGRQIIEMVAPESRELVMDAIRSGRESIYGHLLLRKDGSSFYAEAKAKLVRIGERTLRMTALRDITEQKRAEAERKEFTQQLIASQEAERTRIAGELHDSLGQNLLLVKNRAQLALSSGETSQAAREQLEGVRELATQAIAEVRQIAHALHPYQLDHLGLKGALDVMIDSAASSTDIAFEHKLDSADDVFRGESAINVYRVVQECLNNVLKHSKARHAFVGLERDVHEVRFWVTDDGRGFPLDETRRGFGLRNIAERVHILKGRLKIQSSPGQGTRVEVSVPIAGD